MNSSACYEQTNTPANQPITIKHYQKKELATSSKHWHRSIEFIVPQKNGVEVRVEGNIYHLYPGTLLLINATDIHEIKAINPKLPCSCYFIKIKFDFLLQAIPEIERYTFHAFYDSEHNQDIIDIIMQLIQCEQNTLYKKQLLMFSYAYRLCYELITNYTKNATHNRLHRESKNRTRMIEILDYFDEHITESFDAKKIADSFHLSYGYLAKLFKNELGMTMKEYINSVRIRNASFDLLETDTPIIDIATKHGFVSAKSFYKEFEKVYHMTPKQYRKNFFK